MEYKDKVWVDKEGGLIRSEFNFSGNLLIIMMQTKKTKENLRENKNKPIEKALCVCRYII